MGTVLCWVSPPCTLPPHLLSPITSLHWMSVNQPGCRGEKFSVYSLRPSACLCDFKSMNAKEIFHYIVGSCSAFGSSGNTYPNGLMAIATRRQTWKSSRISWPEEAYGGHGGKCCYNKTRGVRARRWNSCLTFEIAGENESIVAVLHPTWTQIFGKKTSTQKNFSAQGENLP